LLDGAQASPGMLRIAVDTVASLLKQEVPTLVFCGAGMSRSPAIAAAALSVAQGGSPDDRLREVVSGHPHDVSAQLWNEIRAVCADISQDR
jgi:protein-tyrosine phosphatase